ncbi:uncharacterized protein [Ptychodera flava]|uniref:uncharacterized protein n=1 Tax=Ptychodera flava TaxID=63121 RepID=UPI00396A841D
MPYSVYTLELKGRNYYVGSTRDIERRLAEHSGGKCPFTAKHPMEKCIEVKQFPQKNEAIAYERERTLTLMADKGVDRVRGSAWTARHLDQDAKAQLQKMVLHDSGRCFKCGQPGHFSNQCGGGQQWSSYSGPTTVHSGSTRSGQRSHHHHHHHHHQRAAAEAAPTCGRCGRSGHATRDCYAKSYSGGMSMDSHDSRKTVGACYRCGRASHWAEDCYASTDVHGNRL